MSSTLSPTVAPTYMPTLGDAEPSTLVLGMGTGTFTIIVLSVALAIIWLLSMTCTLEAKTLWRGVSTCFYAAVFLLLVFSPREDEYDTSGDDATKVRARHACSLLLPRPFLFFPASFFHCLRVDRYTTTRSSHESPSPQSRFCLDLLQPAFCCSI